MVSSTTITIRLPTDVKDKLARLAQDTRRSKSYLAAEAVAAYVDRETEIIQGIQRGLADIKAGRTVPHEEAMAELDAAIEAAARKRKR